MIFLNLPFWDFFKSFSPFYGEFRESDYWVMMLLAFLALCIVALIVFAIYCLIYGYIDKKRAVTLYNTGVLIDKKYVGEYDSTSTGTVIMPNSNGGVGVGMTSSTSHSPERFLFFVKQEGVHKIEVDMDNYYAYKTGDKVKFEMLVGGLSNEVLEINLV